MKITFNNLIQADLKVQSVVLGKKLFIGSEKKIFI